MSDAMTHLDLCSGIGGFALSRIDGGPSLR
jgi:hypothetical protein